MGKWEFGTYSKLLGSILDLLNFDFREAFDTKESFWSAANESLKVWTSYDNEHGGQSKKLTPTVWMPFCFNFVISAALTPSEVSDSVDNKRITRIPWFWISSTSTMPLWWRLAGMKQYRGLDLRRSLHHHPRRLILHPWLMVVGIEPWSFNKLKRGQWCRLTK